MVIPVSPREITMFHVFHQDSSSYINLHFSVGETSVKPAFFAGRPRQVGRELHFETERGGEPRAVINFTNILGGYYSIYVYV